MPATLISRAFGSGHNHVVEDASFRCKGGVSCHGPGSKAAVTLGSRFFVKIALRFFVPTPLFSLVPSHTLAKRMTFKRFLELTPHVAKVIVFVPKAVLSLVPSRINVEHTSFMELT